MRKFSYGMLAGLCVLPAALGISIWIVSTMTSIGIILLGPDTDMRIARGRFEFRHMYAYNKSVAIPATSFHQIAISNGWTSTPPPVGFPWFGYSSGHVTGISGPGNTSVSTASYSLTHIPVWVLILPSLVLVPVMRRCWKHMREKAGSGFPVIPVAARAMSND